MYIYIYKIYYIYYIYIIYILYIYDWLEKLTVFSNPTDIWSAQYIWSKKETMFTPSILIPPSFIKFCFIYCNLVQKAAPTQLTLFTNPHYQTGIVIREEQRLRQTETLTISLSWANISFSIDVSALYLTQ